MDMEAKTSLIEQITQTLSLTLAFLSCRTQRGRHCIMAGQPAPGLQEERQDPRLVEMSVTLVKILV